MPSSEDTHFDKYTPQTRAKHTILRNYLAAYFRALTRQAEFFHYIDGFAGRGKYEGEYPGSPIIALEALDSVGVIKRSALSVVEDQFLDELRDAITECPYTKSLAYAPLILAGKFSRHMDELLGHEIYSSGKKVATFSFIDPCGVDGVKMADVARLLDLRFGEVLLFFNYDGVNRLSGAISKGTHGIAILRELLGSERQAYELLNAWSDAKDSAERNRLVRDRFVDCLPQESRAQFFLPFRFEAKTRERTSHYLVHACSHALGFRLMKEAMCPVGSELGDEYGKLEFINDGDRGSQFRLFRLDVDAEKDRILEQLRHAPCRVKTFRKDWVESPDNSFCSNDYKKMILELEQERRLSVYDDQNDQPKPPVKRMRNNEPTLGEKLFLRIT